MGNLAKALTRGTPAGEIGPGAAKLRRQLAELVKDDEDAGALAGELRRLRARLEKSDDDGEDDDDEE